MISNTGVVSAAAPPNEAAYARLALKPHPIEVIRDEEPSEEEEGTAPKGLDIDFQIWPKY